jgi:hypothetical protein
MLARGVPITTVADPGPTTLSTYAHAIKGGQDIAAQAMDDFFGAGLKRF